MVRDCLWRGGDACKCWRGLTDPVRAGPRGVQKIARPEERRRYTLQASSSQGKSNEPVHARMLYCDAHRTPDEEKQPNVCQRTQKTRSQNTNPRLVLVDMVCITTLDVGKQRHPSVSGSRARVGLKFEVSRRSSKFRKCDLFVVLMGADAPRITSMNTRNTAAEHAPSRNRSKS
ncbi:hypothetical protein BV25DRAFT_1447256 [Artomyces pyxidatus]|uniref:Uncharacterized protein n=1 Tax=Artomyces pyxidatus TaxID=48021 RepID=A0ACB8SLF5_9AGAM|nr:hypothetical protein BV25DRAFT_1447256 [Artomyces pyxidatus]